MKILYMNSFSRSGETMFQRTMDAHPDVKVLCQLLHSSDENDAMYDVFKRIKNQRPAQIELSPEEKTAIGITSEKILLVKNAVFEVEKPNYGFVLIRNPFSVYASYHKMMQNTKHVRKQMRNWAKLIDPYLFRFVKQASFLDGFCSLYSRKMLSHYDLDQHVVKYEDFIQKPEPHLKALCKSLDIPFAKEMLSAEKRYAKNQKGHGGIDLSKAIFADRAYVLPNLSEEAFDTVYAYCSYALKLYNYNLDDFEGGPLRPGKKDLAEKETPQARQ